MKLPHSFYLRSSVTSIARELLGKLLVTNIDGTITSGIIVETEAYSWRERGCHAYGKRQTLRNSVMFGLGGVAYVYLCYGIHHLFNIVTNATGAPEAVLVRAVQPRDGIDMMMERMDTTKLNRITSGPGKVSKALGINRSLTGTDLTGDTIWLLDDALLIKRSDIVATTRVGIDYAGADALLPWRFYLKNNDWVSVR